MYTDLRDDKRFFVDHPGAVPITTAQVRPKAYSVLLVYYDSLGSRLILSLRDHHIMTFNEFQT